MALPTAERPPTGLDSYWLGVWRHALKVMQEQGTWDWALRPLLDEYVYALKAADATREGFKWLDALERYAEDADDLPDIAWVTLGKIAGGLPTQWDRHAKRAALLADKLVLTPEAQKRHGIFDEPEEEDAFADLDAEDELAKRRSAA